MASCDTIRDLAAITSGLYEASSALGDRDIRVRLLNAIAEALESFRSQIIRTAADETLLTPEELAPEFDRMIGTLRMFAALVLDGSWVRAAIDMPTLAGNVSIGPNNDVRRLLMPLGPAAVFGASNFPLAYGACGGDAASALAAGCPVIVKEHPAHPKTGELLIQIAGEASRKAGCPEAAIRYLRNPYVEDLEPAHLLLQSVHAVGFTGSQKAGLAIAAMSANQPKPIPVFAEMGSVNLVVVTRATMEHRAAAVADEIADAILARFGQQCTRPGVVAIEPCDAAESFIERLSERIVASDGRDMLAPWIRDSYRQRCERVESCRGVRVLARGKERLGPRGGGAVLFGVDELYTRGGDTQIAVFDQESLREEIFGPACIVARVFIDMLAELRLPDALTCSIYAETAEIEDPYSDVSLVLGHALRHAGRLVFNGVPTGVRVCTSMVHGGPFPATNRPDSTAVGPLAIERWCRPVCFQNCPDELLPPELQDANPLGIWRTVNGQPTREPVYRSQS